MTYPSNKHEKGTERETVGCVRGNCDVEGKDGSKSNQELSGPVDPRSATIVVRGALVLEPEDARDKSNSGDDGGEAEEGGVSAMVHQVLDPDLCGITLVYREGC